MKKTLILLSAALWARAPALAAQASYAPTGVSGPAWAIPAFDLSPQELSRAVDQAGALWSARLDEVAALAPDARSFENTVLALEHARADYQEALAPVILWLGGEPTPELRRAAEGISARSDRLRLEQNGRPDVLRALREYAARGEALDPVRASLLKNALELHRLSGAGLPPGERARLRGMGENIDRLGWRLKRNARALEEADLDGARPGGAPEVLARDSVKALGRMLRLRGAAARLLGADSYAEMALSDAILDKPERVRALLEEARALADGAIAERGKFLLEEKRRRFSSARPVRPSERELLADYYVERVHGGQLDRAAESFSAEKAVGGVFSFLEDLLGIRFAPLEGRFWHPDVRAFELSDEEGRSRGRFLLDIFQRPGKSSAGSAASVVDGRLRADGSRAEPLALVLLDLLGPGDAAMEAVWDIADVATFMHEMGHVLHYLLGASDYVSLSSLHSAPDAMEIPSKAIEKLAYLPQVLARIAGHPAGPSALLEDLSGALAGDRFLSPWELRDMLIETSVDLAFHTAVPRDLPGEMRRIERSFGLMSPFDPARLLAGFWHIFSPTYAGVYHSYILGETAAEAIAARLAPGGVIDRGAGREFRRLLEGGSLGAEQLRLFLGRDPRASDLRPGLEYPPPT